MTTERDVRFALLLDQLEARIVAAEATVAELRAEHAGLRKLQDAARNVEVDATAPPRQDRDWLGHELVEQAISLLRPRSGEAYPRG